MSPFHTCFLSHSWETERNCSHLARKFTKCNDSATLMLPQLPPDQLLGGNFCRSTSSMFLDLFGLSPLLFLPSIVVAQTQLVRKILKSALLMPSNKVAPLSVSQFTLERGSMSKMHRVADLSCLTLCLFQTITISLSFHIASLLACTNPCNVSRIENVRSCFHLKLTVNVQWNKGIHHGTISILQVHVLPSLSCLDCVTSHVQCQTFCPRKRLLSWSSANRFPPSEAAELHHMSLCTDLLAR